ncbi:MAG: LysE family translocator [Rhodocyclaceae bacterium]|nr:LysE family translocator [Rhodocyclaceae bacterium]
MEISWWLFVLASLLLIVTPGQDMLLVMSRSIGQGAGAGVASAAGVSVGLVGHTLLATLGLGAILQASEWLFLALKLAGAAYLVWLGIGLLRSGGADPALMAGERRPLWRLFLDGALSNVMNPKIAIFYFAFLPQFVMPGASRPTLSIFALGLCFAALTFLVKAPIGVLAGRLSSWLRARPAVLRTINRCSGLMLLVLGLRLAFERRG